ncbi:extracellular solute-binding protein [Petrocella sp. FN5]|uniref:extracellular solute-binding protein n=1 Tax=Petrocella sp. FN5 TaxID=3032002 RepID=UPI0023D9A57B|nr:extracellular solute-binding protein [Petrocella sp. FN5]MDF1617797.1 extracellular solute-binding protein [Petrocella sp. FN5]
MVIRILRIIIIGIILTGVLSGCIGKRQEEVVIYTSVDQIFAEDILKDFENKTGIKTKTVFDVEATKTVGLANRIISEKNMPQADVYWSGEFVMTILLAKDGLLEPYASPSANDIPSIYKDTQNLWTGYAGRARIILVNKNLVAPKDYPNSIYDFLDSNRDPNMMAIAQPMFGTTMTHAAALYAYLGEDEGRTFFEKLKERGVKVVDGNSVVRDMVVSGQVAFGLTDTDDACIAVKKGDPVEIIIPDQDEMGALVIPNTVALIKDGPNPQAGRKLIDFLLEKDMEKTLIEAGWSHIPVRQIDITPTCMSTDEVYPMQISFEEMFNYRDKVNQDMTTIFVK